MAVPVLTEQEYKDIGAAAQAVWQDIRTDALLASAHGKMTRDEVIELVTDADRLVKHLERLHKRMPHRYTAVMIRWAEEVDWETMNFTLRRFFAAAYSI